jgi:hypothetical protein
MGRLKSGSAELATALEDFPFFVRVFDAFLCVAGFTIRGSSPALELLASASKFEISTPRSCEKSTDSGTMRLESIPLYSRRSTPNLI